MCIVSTKRLCWQKVCGDQVDTCLTKMYTLAMKSLLVFESKSLDAPRNLAIEEWLVDNVSKQSTVLFLWRNDNCVVIGKNQNAYSEVNLKALKEKKGAIVRRLTGGGAVYHDKKNLNFSFIASEARYALDKQFEVVLSAVRSFGIQCEKSGRNDLVTEGKKFSGNAFLSKPGARLHHGTILIDTDIKTMVEVLNVNVEKMKGNGVASVKSRVCNLIEKDVALTTEKMSKRLIESFEKVFQQTPVFLKESDLNVDEIDALVQNKFSQESWIFGCNPIFENKLVQKFAWGLIEICYTSKNGKIISTKLFSDALDCDIIVQIESFLQGQNIHKFTDADFPMTEKQKQIFDDALSLFAK